MKAVDKKLSETLMEFSLDSCFNKAAAAAAKVMQAKAFGLFALDDQTGVRLVSKASDKLKVSSQQAALAALGIVGA